MSYYSKLVPLVPEVLYFPHFKAESYRDEKFDVGLEKEYDP